MSNFAVDHWQPSRKFVFFVLHLAPENLHRNNCKKLSFHLQLSLQTYACKKIAFPLHRCSFLNQFTFFLVHLFYNFIVNPDIFVTIWPVRAREHKYSFSSICAAQTSRRKNMSNYLPSQRWSIFTSKTQSRYTKFFGYSFVSTSHANLAQTFDFFIKNLNSRGI